MLQPELVAVMNQVLYGANTPSCRTKGASVSSSAVSTRACVSHLFSRKTEDLAGGTERHRELDSRTAADS
jgi:hypothetical protein